MRANIAATTVNPMERAANAQDKYIAGIQRAVQSGKWQAGLRSGALESWKSATIEKGIPRYGQGLEQARAKITAMAGPLLAHVDAGVAAVDRMPTASLDQAVAKSAAFIRHMAAFKRPA
jgi:hypothetical protein